MRILAVASLLLGAWWILAETGTVSPLYLPHPYAVAISARLNLFLGVAVTLVRTLTGFIFGILLAYLLHLFTIATNTIDALDAQFAASRSVPIVALMPLFILWFGFGETGRILIVVLTGTAFFLAPLQGAFKGLPREWTILRGQLQLGPIRYYTNIVFPGTLPGLNGAFRLSMAVCFTIAIASDYMGAQIGLGKFIDTARVTYNVPGIFLALLVSAGLGLVLDTLIQIIFEKFVHWRGKTAKA